MPFARRPSWFAFSVLAALSTAAPQEPTVPPPGEMARCLELIRAGDYPAARARLEPLVAEHPGWQRAIFLLGLSFHEEHRHGEARPLLERALGLDPTSPDATAIRSFLGWSLYYLGEPGAARRQFEAFVRARPDDADAYYALGLLDLESGELEAAERRLRTAVRLAVAARDGPVEGKAHARLADLAHRRGDLALAKTELEAAVRLRPESDEARFKLARVLELLESDVPEAPAPAPSVPGDRGRGIRFSDVTAASGVDFRMTSGKSPPTTILEVDGGGVALFDFDDDGDLDLFLANGATLDAPERGPGSRLYRNRGDGTFEDVTARAGIALRRWAMGVAVGDADGDGRDDLYVTCYGPNALLRNETTPEAGPRFRDVTAEAGVGDRRWSTSAAFGDLDGDGDLDLYVANYLVFDAAKPPPRDRVFQGERVMAGPAGLAPEPDTLYRNEGAGRFRDVTREAGIVERTAGYGLGVRLFDADGDGRLDIFVGNDSTENFLFRNLGGMRFEENGARSGVAANSDGGTQATMGIALGDVDGNGLPDLYSTNFSHDTNTLHLNLGRGFFDDCTSQYGLGLESRPYLGWGAGLYDFDLDGDEDLFVANGHVYPEMAGGRHGTDFAQPALVYERRGGRFARTVDAGAPTSAAYLGRAAAFGDLDGDGDPDVVMTTLGGPVHIFRNDAPAARALAVALEQPGANHRAYGAVVELEAGGRRERRFITGGGSFQSADSPLAHFGLVGIPDDVRLVLSVRWPDGETTRAERPRASGHLILARKPAQAPR